MTTQSTTTKSEERFNSIETWKVDLSRLLHSFENGRRPDGKTGKVGTYKTIEDFVDQLIKSTRTKALEEGRRLEDVLILGFIKEAIIKTLEGPEVTKKALINSLGLVEKKIKALVTREEPKL